MQSLDNQEKEELKRKTQEEIEKYEEDINKKYHDKFKCNQYILCLNHTFTIGSIMMDPESTKARNEIMRRVKNY